MSNFKWDSRTSNAAFLLAQGYTYEEVAKKSGVSARTISRWKEDEEFLAEIDRLSLMIGIASRAERLRIAMMVIRQKISEEGFAVTEKDLLDWLKYAQGETDGVKLDLVNVMEALTNEDND